MLPGGRLAFYSGCFAGFQHLFEAVEILPYLYFKPLVEYLSGHFAKRSGGGVVEHRNMHFRATVARGIIKNHFSGCIYI